MHRILLILWSCSLVLASPRCPAGDPSATPLPRPLIEFHFSGDTTNSGTLGGGATLMEYAVGQGAKFGQGTRGTGLDLTSSSRGGGTDNTRAGGAAVFKDSSVAKLERLTIALWCKPIGPNSPARLFNLGPRGDLTLANGAIGFKVRSNQTDAHFNVPRQELDLAPDQWHFIALSHDLKTGTARIHHAVPGQATRPIVTWSNMPHPDATSQGLEIGNFNGIRPFHGLIDSVRLYDIPLSNEQVDSVAALDPARPPALIHQLPRPPVRQPIFRHSDVCFTSRSKHTNSVETFQTFRANRLLWTYAADGQFAANLRAAGAETFQCAINSLPGTTETAAHALDFDGAPMVAPWMRAFSRKSPVYWACNNRPRFLEISLDRTKKALDAGADMIQFDDWSLVVSASGWGGACFCGNCMALFGDDIRRHASKEQLAEFGVPATGPFNYKTYLQSHHGITNAAAYADKKRTLPTTPLFESFQRRSVRQFFTTLRRRIDAIAGRRVPLSINTNLSDPSQQRQFIADISDFAQGETLRFPLDQLSLAAKAAESLAKWHVFVTQSLDVPEARAGIASIYALGQLPMVPWDMYMGSDEIKIQPRGWGTTDQYADLFYFVRDNAALFDNFDPVAIAGIIVNIDRFDRSRVLDACRRLLDAQVPFAILPCGHSYFAAPLDTGRLSGFEALILTGSVDDLAQEDRAALIKAAADTHLLDAQEMDDGSLKDLSIAEIWAPRGVNVLARAPRDFTDKTLLIHVLNRASAGYEMRWISLVLKPRVLAGRTIKTIRWHAPGQEPSNIEIENLPTGTRLLIPRIKEWGIAEIGF